ncbi:hypothetical protein [Sphingobium sp. Ant17]|jgi:hypothetical protein|uniref:hypothetical protein n=1 Tax=Sphingobium sp. Ant17 TaxID=1461752 RepID=UPI00044A410D|nr:hypothetical protein [Sphingobium sp. Ant17]EXS69860.1 hypothetical protein BF95_06650 [Sphingobium sp. Ant17]|tara:strand:- start:2946 stop:3428 length:483 start_codon:yes stop_codon:yes gene_type:complete
MVRTFALLLTLAACSDSREVLDELPNSSLVDAQPQEATEARMDTPAAQPVMIGEDGLRFDACGGLGQVSRSGAGGLPLLAAPFADAKILARLPDGQRAYICNRSLDQKWLGVVVQPVAPADGAPAAPDCGVSSPVDRKQAYDGPCVSGWLASPYVRLIGG